MGFRCGIIGLPNVGKSTLFNALTKTAAAQAENYPFCTIEPNVGVIVVPDPRLAAIADVSQSAKIVPTSITFVDIAGLVRGAADGNGLGNQFLARIREVDVIIHVLRCFDNSDVMHVEGKVDPISDAAVVNTELMLADMASLERRVAAIRKKPVNARKDDNILLPVMENALSVLQDGKPVRVLLDAPYEIGLLNSLMLLTVKPVLYVCNVDELSIIDENEYTRRVKTMVEGCEASYIVISAKAESEIAQLSQEDALDFLQTMGLHESGLSCLIRAGYEKLGLITYFTVGPKETRAWTIRKNTKAPQAAGVIHSDFEKHFIRASTVSYEDYIQWGGLVAAKEAGRVREEGKEYLVQDGDIILFRCGI